jgi:hypothetical protein
MGHEPKRGGGDDCRKKYGQAGMIAGHGRLNNPDFTNLTARRSPP